MIVDAINKITQLARAAADRPLNKMPGDNANRLYWQDDQGNVHYVYPERGPREITGVTLPELVQFAIEPAYCKHPDPVVRWGDPTKCGEAVAGLEITPADRLLTYTPYSAVLTLDVEAPDEFVRWDTRATSEMDIVTEWYEQGPEGKEFTVEESVNLFDTYLRETLPDVSFLKKIGQLKVASEESAEASHEATSSMVGGIKKANVSSPMPDAEIVLNIKVQEDPLLPRLPLRCYVRANMMTRRWLIMPVPSSYAKLVTQAAKEVRDMLIPAIDAGVPCVRSNKRITRVH